MASEISSSHSIGTIDKFRLKCANFGQVDRLVRNISLLTLVKGCHLGLKRSEVIYSGMYCLFLLIGSISFQK